MAMSQDRVRFFLPYRYFQTRPSSNAMSRDTCVRVLVQAFGNTACFWRSQMERHTDGFWIRCRPSQFARFIVHRHDADECINGVKDLRPAIVGEHDPYQRVADATGVDRNSVKRVLLAACWEPSACQDDEFDVSCNRHRP